MQSRQLRSTFINYFRNSGHKAVASSSLVPANDPTLLFTNSGMVQFKDVFLGKQQLDYSKAVTAQRCVRAGGKHNDLDNVGYTARHHTFFEMLGNFSFGEYFKQQAIAYAWEFVTKVLKLPEERLWITVYHDDSQSESIWLDDIKVSPERFSRLGDSNFWQMGDTGPCGPCSEIFYDHGTDVAGGPPGTPEEDGDRYVEIWNLVFMQYQRDQQRELTELAHPSVDTGMGLERISAVMQGVVSNYNTDLFVPLIKASMQATNCTKADHPSIQVIADHLRSSCFLLLDGVTPSNERRGYVLRRIIRRAIRHGHSLGCNDSFFHQLSSVLVELMGEPMPELKRNHSRIQRALKHEESQFQRTLSQGMQELDKACAHLTGTQLSGDLLFWLYDTFGFPVDMVGDVARERGYTLDLKGFEQEMQRQRQQSRSSASFTGKSTQLEITGETSFVGYDNNECESTVLHLVDVSGEQSSKTDRLTKGSKGAVILASTTFYAESGGQVGDRGLLLGEEAKFVVEDTRKIGGNFWHFGYLLAGELKTGERVKAQIDSNRRARVMRNHSATHLMHAALHQILGDGVIQRGSLVDDQRLRFDFSHTQPVTSKQQEEISLLVNTQIAANLSVTTSKMSLKEATEQGALAFFEEKYGEEVRVLTIGGALHSKTTNSSKAKPFSIELCGGTHVSQTGEIGCFHIVSESAVASGVRRIEAITGQVAIQHLQNSERLLNNTALLAKTSTVGLPQVIQSLQQQLSVQAKEIAKLQARLATASTDGQTKTEQIGSFNALLLRVDDTPPEALSQVIDQHVNRLKTAGIVILAGNYQNRVVLAAGVTADASSVLHAGKILASLAPLIAGKAGGKPHFAQGGGSNVQAIEQLFEKARVEIAKAN